MTDTHRHYWTHADDDPTWRCAECAETTETCCECGKAVTDDRGGPSSLLICQGCVQRWGDMLDRIATATEWFRWVPPSTIQATRYDRDRIRGSRGDNGSRLTIWDLPALMESWRRMWAEAVGDTAPELGSLAWMKGRILWAAHNQEASVWDEWKAEMRSALHAAKRDAGLLPRIMPAPCAHCQGVAVRTWADRDLTPHDDGISDEVMCLGCGLTWKSESQYRQLSKTHLRALPLVRPDVLVTRDQARSIWPSIPASTWRRWASDGELPDPVAWDERGAPQYMVASLEVLVDRRASETRRGPKVARGTDVA